ncbi:MAG: LuxR C-terminal-related transcriptional regulator [Saprospiraceae bacterium]
MKTIFIAKTGRLLCDILSACCVNLGLQVIGTSTDGLETLDQLEKKSPDFAIIDAGLPSINGFELIQQLNHRNKSIRTILYLQNRNPNHLRKALSASANALLFAEDRINELRQCFVEGSVINRFASKRVEKCLNGLATNNKNDDLNLLTPTQLRVLSLVSSYKTMPEIAKKLFISPHTVNNHIANIRRKLDLQGRGVVLKYALEIKHRLIEVNGKVMVSNDQSQHFSI